MHLDFPWDFSILVSGPGSLSLQEGPCPLGAKGGPALCGHGECAGTRVGTTDWPWPLPQGGLSALWQRSIAGR